MSAIAQSLAETTVDSGAAAVSDIKQPIEVAVCIVVDWEAESISEPGSAGTSKCP